MFANVDHAPDGGADDTARKMLAHGASYGEQAAAQALVGRPTTSVEINGTAYAVGGGGGRHGNNGSNRRAHRGHLPDQLPEIGDDIYAFDEEVDEEDPYASPAQQTQSKRQRHSDSAVPTYSHVVEESPPSSESSGPLIGAWQQLVEAERGEPSPVADFLAGIGMGQYENVFRANEISTEMLKELDHRNLQDMDVGVLGHRFKILKGVKNSPYAQR